MARRNPRPRRRRALGLSVVALTTVLAGAIAPPVTRAQPAGEPVPAPAPAPDDLERAKDLYRLAEAAMKDGRFDDAARDYGAAYQLSQDAALFFKIGHAHERGGTCDLALIYYARYLREGHPTEQFIALTHERVAACGGGVPGSVPPASPPPGAGTGSSPPAASGSAAPGSAAIATDSAATTAGSAGAATPAGPVTAGSLPPAEAEARTGPAAGNGSAPPPLIPPTRQKVAWLMGGTAIALVTLGGVLAYAASSSENDVRDLYAGFAGHPPPFDSQTQKQYDDLIDQGRRYQHLSWLSFGLAGAAAVGTAVLFAVGGEEPAHNAQHARITPVVTSRSAGVVVRF